MPFSVLSAAQALSNRGLGIGNGAVAELGSVQRAAR
jgi:hypothetical protein